VILAVTNPDANVTFHFQIVLQAWAVGVPRRTHVLVMQYEEYFELAERNGWRVSDLDWSALEADDAAGLVGELDRSALQGTAVIEHGVPHYAEVWSLVEDLRKNWQLWQFTTLWTGEEHRHSYALQKACAVLGLAGEIEHDLHAVAEFPFAERQKQSCVDDCYRSVPGMLTYAIIQELATNHFYLMAAKQSRSPFLAKLFRLIAGDEMRHHCFYRDALRDAYQASADKPWFCDQVFRAARAFKMPHLIYGLQVAFFERGGWDIGVEVKVQLARCFAFDGTLIERMIAAYAPPAAA
jgi:hypothetical protein